VEIVLLLLLVAVATTLAVTLTKKRAGDVALQAAREQIRQYAARVEALSVYQGIPDAEVHARSIVEAAQRGADDVMATARRDADALRSAADATVAQAQSEAVRLVEEAKAKANEIAGEAFAAIENAKQAEQTAAAMRNVIEGYGDRYIVPTFSILDEMADELGFTEAGQKLKAARTRTREMIRHGTAATCDYVEVNRRATAIEFVLDAFNGKVDTILADVRHDNYGTLAQRIKDAFVLVNRNGEAFRRARITDLYLETRLDELRWAVVVHELKLREREEQRAIKERIREEERAQREFEKAQKEAVKEEEFLRKAMEKAQEQVAKASDAQKAKYEEQLRALTEKLRLAEEKNQRALSMAQQTKAGNVYVISNVGAFGENVFKIGMTRRLEPLERVKELGDASVPFDFDVHAMVYSDDAPSLEHELHKRFVRAQVNKVNPRKEFFRVPLVQVREEIERLGCKTAWTMAAKAAEYHETLAIERAMQETTFQENEWAEKQLKEHDAALVEPVRLDASA
jgi:hypothetical protein